MLGTPECVYSRPGVLLCRHLECVKATITQRVEAGVHLLIAPCRWSCSRVFSSHYALRHASLKSHTHTYMHTLLTPSHTNTHTHTHTLTHTVLPYFNEYLPTEVLVHIFSFLRERDLCRIGHVCQRFRQISNLDSLWKNLFRRIFEMDEAYTPPTPFTSLTPLTLSPSTKGHEDMDTSDSESPVTWKSQFKTMVCVCVCVCVPISQYG